jgi:glycerol-3-phosphate dehydrogenase
MSIFKLNKEAGAAMPIADTVYRILWEGMDPSAAFSSLEGQLY